MNTRVMNNLTSAYFNTVTPSDSAGDNMDPAPRALFIGSDGTIAAVREDGVVVTFQVFAGQEVNISPVRINATGTTATGIVGLW